MLTKDLSQQSSAFIYHIVSLQSLLKHKQHVIDDRNNPWIIQVLLLSQIENIIHDHESFYFLKRYTESIEMRFWYSYKLNMSEYFLISVSQSLDQMHCACIVITFKLFIQSKTVGDIFWDNVLMSTVQLIYWDTTAAQVQDTL